MSMLEKLFNLVVYNSNECWIFIGGRSTQGYGYISDGNGKKWRAHILSYTLNKGDVPEGMLVLHTCDNPSCINPDHLFLGNHQDNVDDMRAKNRDAYGHNKGEMNGQAKLTEDNVIIIKRLLASDQYTQDQIGAMFGVTRGAVKQIKRGITWRHLNGRS
jgi:hypothetical protein